MSYIWMRCRWWGKICRYCINYDGNYVTGAASETQRDSRWEHEYHKIGQVSDFWYYVSCGCVNTIVRKLLQKAPSRVLKRLVMCELLL